VSTHVPLGELDIDVMQQPGKPPRLLILILAKVPRQRPHDRLSGQHMVDEVPILHISLDGGQGIVPIYSIHFLHYLVSDLYHTFAETDCLLSLATYRTLSKKHYKYSC